MQTINSLSVIRRLSNTEAYAVFAYIQSGNRIKHYKPGLRALPPNAESILNSGRKIKFYCVQPYTD